MRFGCRLISLLVVAISAIAVLSAGARAPGQPLAAPATGERPNIILVLADDLGDADLGCYGQRAVKTPHIDGLARDGMRFTQAFVTTSSCSPSRASMLCGAYPHNTGAARLHQPLPGDRPTFAAALRGRGYWTGAAGKWHLGDEARKNFDLVLDGTAAPPAGRVRDGSGCDDWLDLLERRAAGQPFFLWLASFDPHRPYDAASGQGIARGELRLPPYLPDQEEVRADLARYYGEVERLDSHVRRLLTAVERAGLTGNTLVVLLSDNGRPFPREKTTLYDSGIRTPLVMRLPGRVPAGAVSDALVSTVDLAATFVALAGGEPWPAPSRSMLPLWSNPRGEIRQTIFAEQNWHDFEARGRAVRDTHYKYIRNEYADLPPTPPADVLESPAYRAMRELHGAGRLAGAAAAVFASARPSEELYDLDADPHELNNLAGDRTSSAELQEALARLRGQLDRWQHDHEDRPQPTRTPDAFDRTTGGRRF